MVTTVQEVLQANPAGVAVLVELDFIEGPFRVWAGFGSLTTLDGREWLPVSQFGGVGVINESEEVTSRGVSLSLNRAANGNELDPVAFAAAVNAERNRTVWKRRAFVLFQAFDPETLTLIGLPQVEFKGSMSHITTSREGGVAASIAVHCENVWGEGWKPTFIHYTAEDQLARYPGDRGFEYIPANANRRITWPRD